MKKPGKNNVTGPRDHGGGIDSSARVFGGERKDWLDLSTGVNPVPFRVNATEAADWTALPDRGANSDLIAAARTFWRVPEKAAVLAVPGASAAIARIPALAPSGSVRIDTPTYNEHAAAFLAHRWKVDSAQPSDAQVCVHPNNPDGRLWSTDEISAPFSVIDESFCDVCPELSLIELSARPGHLVLKSFGKFWGLAGLRLGFVIGDPEMVDRLATLIGPWPVSGPALRIGARALTDTGWAETTRVRLARDAARLDNLVTGHGAQLAGGTTLFRLYRVDDAKCWHDRLARQQILTRTFPYSDNLIRFGLPPATGWNRLETAL